MISTQQALQFITQHCQSNRRTQVLALDKSLGYVLRENIYADRDQPPANKSAMDGIAVSYKAYQLGVRSFKVIGVLKADSPAMVLLDSQACYRIMTGAILPKGADLVIPVEYVNVKDSIANISGTLTVTQGQFIRPQGSDARKGDILLESGAVINPVVMGLLASVGKNRVKVSLGIKVAVVSTGDELVSVSTKPKAHQTRISNNIALKALFNQIRFVTVKNFHLKDNPLSMKKKLREILKVYDVVVLSGGVSKGDFDYVPAILTSLGVKNIFHHVLQKPGKPLWFGKTTSNTIVFGLPGNPVSTLICAYRYIVEAVYLLAGSKEGISLRMSLKQPIKSKFVGTEFLPFNDQPVNINNSGDFIGLSKARGFIQNASGELNDQCSYFSWRF